MPFVTPDDVASLHAAIKAEADGLSQAVKNCMFDNTIPASDPVVAQWVAMRTRVDTYLADEPSWLNTASQMNAGEQLQRDLQPWHDLLTKRGCKNVPMTPSPPPQQADLFGSIKDIGFILIALLVLSDIKGLKL